MREKVIVQVSPLDMEATRARALDSLLLWTPCALTYGDAAGVSLPTVSTWYAYPFFMRSGWVIEKMAMNISTVVAGATVRFAIWERTSYYDIAPGKVLCDSGLLSAEVAGWITKDVAIKVPYTGVYLGACIPSATGISSRGFSVSTARAFMFKETGAGVTSGKQIAWSGTIGAGPEPFPRTSLLIQSGSFACGWIRFSQASYV